MNQRKEEMLLRGGVGDRGLVHAFDDLTDRENVNFRYVY